MEKVQRQNAARAWGSGGPSGCQQPWFGKGLWHPGSEPHCAALTVSC